MSAKIMPGAKNLTNFHCSINIEKNCSATEVLVDIGEPYYELVLVRKA
jgi:hypothetical protein